MKIFVISPIADSFFSAEEVKTLQGAGELVLQKSIVSLEQVPGLTAPGDKILALDPDWFDWKIGNDIFEKIPDIKAVVLQTTSFSWLDTEFLATQKIPVVNMRGFSKNAVAEWAIMTALLLSRKTPIVMKDGWKQDFVKHKGYELRGKLAGIIGIGRNGTAIAEDAAGLGMSVQYWSAHNDDSRFKKVELADLMRTSDIIFPAYAHNADTEKLLNDDLLLSMKPNAIFVSTIHRIYNHDLLLKRVGEGKLWGYGFEENNPNFTAYVGNIWAGPSLAWCTEESMRENARQWTEAIILATRNQFPNRIN